MKMESKNNETNFPGTCIWILLSKDLKLQNLKQERRNFVAKLSRAKKRIVNLLAEGYRADLHFFEDLIAGAELRVERHEHALCVFVIAEFACVLYAARFVIEHHHAEGFRADVKA